MSSDGRPRVVVLVTLAAVGGAQSYVAALVPALAERFDVVVAAHGDGALRVAAARAGVRFVALRHLRRALGARDVLGLLELVRLLRRERPQILHANSSKAGVLGRLAAALAGVPVRIFTAHGWAFGAERGAAGRVYRWADRLVLPLTTAVVCVSESERRAGLQARTCDPERTWVIHNGVDVGAAPQSSVGGEPPLIVSVGRLQAPKDPLTLVRALGALPHGSFRAVMVGDGPDREAVAAEIAASGLAGVVALVGDRDDVPALLEGADVFVLATRSEGFPLSVVEAMAAGLPVVASSVGGIPEAVLDGETGLLVAPQNPPALASALAHVLQDGARRRSMGAAGRARAAERFDLAGFRAAHVALYERALAAAPNRSRR
jgi:glycosyltransferase involved in cell wall biosynthesis